MSKDEYLKGLTEEQKKALFEAKTQEELDGMLSQDDAALSDEDLDNVAGGCFRPTRSKKGLGDVCQTCGMPVTYENGVRAKTCVYCGDPIPTELDAPLEDPSHSTRII